jgi:hypothetical protein
MLFALGINFLIELVFAVYGGVVLYGPGPCRKFRHDARPLFIWAELTFGLKIFDCVSIILICIVLATNATVLEFLTGEEGEGQGGTDELTNLPMAEVGGVVGKLCLLAVLLLYFTPLRLECHLCVRLSFPSWLRVNRMLEFEWWRTWRFDLCLLHRCGTCTCTLSDCVANYHYPSLCTCLCTGVPVARHSLPSHLPGQQSGFAG